MPEYLVKYRKRKNGPLHEYYTTADSGYAAELKFRNNNLKNNTDYNVVSIWLNVWEGK